MAVPARRHLVELLRTEGSLSTRELADRTGLHLTTVRFHLDVLARAGLVEAGISPTGGPGRPRRIFSVVPDQPATDEAHRALVAVLAAEFGTDPSDSRVRAERAGRRWAEELTPDSRPHREATPAGDAAILLGETFERLGFAPQVSSAGRAHRIDLHACPFRATARAHPDVICAAHGGLLRGTLARLGVAGADQAVLRPFVRADLCVAEFSSSEPGEASPFGPETLERAQGVDTS